MLYSIGSLRIQTWNQTPNKTNAMQMSLSFEYKIFLFNMGLRQIKMHLHLLSNIILRFHIFGQVKCFHKSISIGLFNCYHFNMKLFLDLIFHLHFLLNVHFIADIITIANVPPYSGVSYFLYGCFVFWSVFEVLS